MKKLISLNTCLYLCFFCLNTVTAQTKIPITIDKSAKVSIQHPLLCDKDFNFCGLWEGDFEKTGKTIDGILIKVTRTEKGFDFVFDDNQDGKLANDKKYLIAKNSEVTIEVKRKYTKDKIEKLPYVVSHQRMERNGKRIDFFGWTPHYRAVGQIKYKNCLSQIALLDLESDGFYNQDDAERGTNFQIDHNGDGKIWGKEEHAYSSQIIEFCGQNFLISSIASDGSSVTLEPTNLRFAKIGEKVPSFSLVLLNGKELTSESLLGKSYVLDFWASWCAPCVENFPRVKEVKSEFEKEISVISINVDNSLRRSSAEQVIEKYQLYDFSAIRGLGNDDPLWKTFGGANLNRLAIPLYVLVDKNGTTRYADNGGKELEDLRNKIIELK